MQDPPSLFARDDTLFGVCQALGEDFGLDPFWLRAALAVLVLVDPVAFLALYAGAGLLVALSRWLVPNPGATARAAAAEHAPPGADEDAGSDPVPLAA